MIVFKFVLMLFYSDALQDLLVALTAYMLSDVPEVSTIVLSLIMSYYCTTAGP